MADNKITATRPGLDTVKCVDMQTLTEKIKHLPPQAISYIAGAVEMASLLQNKGLDYGYPLPTRDAGGV